MISVHLSNKAGSSETTVLSEGVLHVNKSEIIKCKLCEQSRPVELLRALCFHHFVFYANECQSTSALVL